MSLRVLLVNMPFGGVDRPAIGISTLKAGLKVRHITCDIKYLNFIFAQMVGPQLYQWFSDRASHMIFAGEWMFAKDFFGDDIPPDAAFYNHLVNRQKIDHRTLDTIRSLREAVRPFLETCLKTVNWSAYDVIGFTSTFEQNVASIAMAHAVKLRYPDKVIVMGGANCEGSMGLALHRHFPCLDYVFTGAADHTFPEFVDRLKHGRATSDIPGYLVSGPLGR